MCLAVSLHVLVELVFNPGNSRSLCFYSQLPGVSRNMLMSPFLNFKEEERGGCCQAPHRIYFLRSAGSPVVFHLGEATP